MLRQAPVVAVTGATGYLGSQICETLESSGWQAIRLVRSTVQGHGQALSYDLATPIAARRRKLFDQLTPLYMPPTICH